MKEIILITAAWCTACHAMEKWFFTVEMPGITFKAIDIADNEIENLSSVPAVLFKENGEIVQTAFGAKGKAELTRVINSIWPEDKNE